MSTGICSTKPPPSSPPPLLPPATVVITPAGEIRRTRWLPESATRIDPSGRSTASVGARRAALVALPPSPPKPATPVPATVAMVPSGKTFRTWCASESVMSSPPSADGLTEAGSRSSALVAAPPSPASPAA